MGFDPMDMKRMVIEGLLEDLKSKDKKKRIGAIETLGKTIGIGAHTGLEDKAIKAIKETLKDKNKDVQKAAKEALKMIGKQQTSDMLGMFDGGVGFSKN